jgi:hypothetical protein
MFRLVLPVPVEYPIQISLYWFPESRYEITRVHPAVIPAESLMPDIEIVDE